MEILGEQVRQLYRLSRPTYVATLLVAGIVTFLLWDVVRNAWLLAWLVVLAAVIAAHYALYRAYFREPRPPDEAPLWARRFVIGAGTTGVVWGFAGSALYPVASLAHQLLVVFLIGGMVLSAMVILAPVRQAFLAYMLPPMALLTATVFAQGTTLHLFIGVALVVFMGVMLGTAPLLSDLMLESLRVKFENSALVERLSQANRELSDRIAAQQQTEAALRQTSRKFEALIDASPLAIILRDRDGRIESWNAAAQRIFGWSEREVRGKDPPIWPSDRSEEVAGVRERLLQGETVAEIETVRRRKDGTLIEVRMSGAPVHDASGETVGQLTIVADVTERKRGERRQNLLHAITVLLSEARTIDEAMQKVIQTMCDGFDYVYGARWVLESSERLLRCAESWCIPDPALNEFRQTSSDRLEISGTPGGLNRRVWSTSAPVWITDVAADATLRRREPALKAGLRSAFAFPILVEGEFYGVMEFFGRAVRPRDDGVIEVAQTVGAQIGQFIARKHAENNLQFFASHDPLTGLFNRSMFHERLQQALAQAQRFERTAALLFIDLDGFKLINDTLGHNAGDALLVEIAGRLRTSLREGDVIARMGGDEFVVLIEEFAEAGQVAEVAKKILETVAKPYVLHNEEYSVTTSIGVATYPKDGTDAQSLLKNADIAMYRAKEGGKNNFRFSAPEMNVHLIERLTLESGLRRALERDEMRLLYQPKVSIRTGGVTGIEALVRWSHPTQGTISPHEFVPIAEDTGLINAIGEWVLRTACEQARDWREQGLPWVRIAVNLSARQFGQDNLIQVVREVLHDVRLDAERLELEITEGMVIRNPERAVKVLAQLRELGVRVTLDDFGTGYSSLGYLMRCPVDAVKLDRSFVLKLPGDTDSATIAQAVIAMAHSLKLAVVAEGVETREQWEFLRGLDCDEMQGNYFSEPVTADIVPGLLRQPSAPGKRASVQTLHSRRGESGGEMPES
jgi:diguanylate cyclase (GGDEF)-like protein/PAS domain S-box-containing protein